MPLPEVKSVIAGSEIDENVETSASSFLSTPISINVFLDDATSEQPAAPVAPQVQQMPAQAEVDPAACISRDFSPPSSFSSLVCLICLEIPSLKRLHSPSQLLVSLEEIYSTFSAE